jgi:hypothetical protein
VEWGKARSATNAKRTPFGVLFALCKGYKKDIFDKELTGFELSAFMQNLIV